MSDETYPSTLPRPEVEGYSFSVSSNSIRTDSDNALYKRRRRSATQIFSIPVTMRYTDAQMEIFQDWFTTDLSDGSEIFDISLAFGDGVKTNVAKFEGGQFDFAYVNGTNEWDVTATLEVWAANTLDDAANFVAAGFTLAGSVSYQIDLALGEYENMSYGITGSQVIDLSGGTYENLIYAVGSSSSIDLSAGTYEDGST